MLNRKTSRWLLLSCLGVMIAIQCGFLACAASDAKDKVDDQKKEAEDSEACLTKCEDADSDRKEQCQNTADSCNADCAGQFPGSDQTEQLGDCQTDCNFAQDDCSFDSDDLFNECTDKC